MEIACVVLAVMISLHAVQSHHCSTSWIKNADVKIQKKRTGSQNQQNAFVYEKVSPLKEFFDGDILFQFCQTGYHLPTTGKTWARITCSHGKWNPDLQCRHQPTCSEEEFTCNNHKCIHKNFFCDQIDDCGDGSDEANCDVPNCSDEEFTCSNRKCITNSWVCDQFNDCGDNSDEQSCVTCTDPGPIANGRSTPIGMESNAFSMGSSIEYSCNRLYNLKGQKTISCEPDGSWSAEKPQCIPDKPSCSEEEEFTCKNNNCVSKYWVCDQIQDCGDGSDELNCVKCKDPGRIANGISAPISKEDNVFLMGSSIEYSCNSPHFLKGEKTIVCTSDGTWSAEKPECMRVDACEDLPIPFEGSVSYVSPPHKDQSSRSGMHPEWSPQSSRRIGLPGLTDRIPQNIEKQGTSEARLASNLHQVGTQAIYACDSVYYALDGSNTMRRCLKGGKWSGSSPTCKPVCGRSYSPMAPNIVNGNVSNVGQWPWQAAIAQWDNRRWFLICGGSLINEQWVTTAAHCVTYEKTKIVIEISKFRIYLGKHHRSDSKDDEFVQVKQIEEMYIHPDYNPNNFDSDIAVIQLDSPVYLNSRVQPVCLPSKKSTRENLIEGNEGVVTGWGFNEKNLASETLRQAALPVVSQTTCQAGYRTYGRHIIVTDNMYCAGFAGGKRDSCNGDSGGPMVFRDKENICILEGIVSWGSPEGCGKPNQYGAYTKVGRFVDWIHTYF